MATVTELLYFFLIALPFLLLLAVVLDIMDILRRKTARKNLHRSRREARRVLNAYADNVARPNALMHLPHEERVDLMPSYTFSAGKWPESVKTCIICLEEYKSHDTLRFMLSCRHNFHQPCIDKWLRHAVSCPLCRQSVFLPEPPRRRLPEEVAAARRSQRLAHRIRQSIPDFVDHFFPRVDEPILCISKRFSQRAEAIIGWIAALIGWLAGE